MCGICGYYSPNLEAFDPGLLGRMCSRIVHRGPDDQGMFEEHGLALGMRRLSIIDLDHGSQPIFNEDRSVCVVFNGEIYNFLELRKELQARGHRLGTRTDTEVIVHLYEDFGIDFVQKLNGMFSIALWDRRERRLVIVRDRLGVKPLYYFWGDEGLVFGSELKCVLECPDVPRKLDADAVYHYFTLGYIPHPASIYADVHQLPPAGRLVIQNGCLSEDSYWSLQSNVNRSLSRSAVKEELRELLTDAVKIRMISDVPLGAFLSGGLDSSIVVALMAKHSSAPVKTFYIDFDEPEYSERAYAKEIAEKWGTEHHELVVKPSAVEILDDLIDFFDEPFADASAVPTYYVSKLTRRHVTVALAGDGGDESFGGYQRYQRILARRPLPRFVRSGLGMLGEAIHHGLPRRARGRRYFRSLGMDNRHFFAVGTRELETREILTPEFLETVSGTSTFELVRPYMESGDASDPLAPYATLDVNSYLPDDILTKVDRMSMAHSLEVRAPFLDYRVAELAARLPYDWKITGGDTKVILKEIFAEDLTPSVLQPRKRGFSMPLEHWLRHDLRPHLEEVLDDSALRQAGILDMKEARNWANEHWSGVRNRDGQLWRILVFSRWWKRR